MTTAERKPYTAPAATTWLPRCLAPPAAGTEEESWRCPECEQDADGCCVSCFWQIIAVLMSAYPSRRRKARPKEEEEEEEEEEETDA